MSTLYSIRSLHTIDIQVNLLHICVNTNNKNEPMLFRSTVLAMLFTLSNASAIDFTKDTLIVAIDHFPPEVIIDDGEITGFDIDIWHAIAADLGVEYRFQQVEFQDIFHELREGNVDLAISGITINAEREKLVDFSQHYLDSGLRIMVRTQHRADLSSKISRLLTPGVIKGMLYLTLFIFICGQVLWLSERGKDAINDKYFPGIFEAFWCVITTMTTVGYGDIAPRKWLGRAAAFLVMLMGIGLFGWIVGEFAAATTIEKMGSSITSYHDLRGKRVATVKATTSVKTIKDVGAMAVITENPENAYNQLINGHVDAVVYDSPNVQYYANNQGAGKVILVGELFEPQYYGIAFPEGSQLLEPVNRALLKLRERRDGHSIYDSIYQKWFGNL